MLSLVGDLAETGRRPLHRESLDAREPVLMALGMMRQPFAAKGVALHEALAAEPLILRADSRAMTQIALNLLTNALKFTPPGGAVTLTLARIEGDVALTVADTGAGFAPGAPEGSTGLGLALTRALARAHGGELFIAAPDGPGARVAVRLPAQEA
jgi:cell cycle sensor histidine kinase DivJ